MDFHNLHFFRYNENKNLSEGGRAMFTRKTVLVVDDEVDILRIIETVLKKEGIGHVITATTAKEGLEKFNEEKPDLILLDIMLPDGEGYAVGQEIRQKSMAPILFVSAKSEEFDRILGFAMGGEDYITKPFSPKELAYRVKAQLRRADFQKENNLQKNDIVKIGPFKLDKKIGEFYKDAQKITLRPKEYHLMEYFLENKNKIISKENLYDRVWGEDAFGSENTIMVHIRRLREKIETNPSQPKYLKTVKGLGYKLEIKED